MVTRRLPAWPTTAETRTTPNPDQDELGIDWKAAWETEDNYWQENFSSRPYALGPDYYDRFRPAYRYGFESARHQPGPVLGRRRAGPPRPGGTAYQRPRAAARRAWDEIKAAVRDAWDRVTGRSHRRHRGPAAAGARVTGDSAERLGEDALR